MRMFKDLKLPPKREKQLLPLLDSIMSLFKQTPVLSEDDLIFLLQREAQTRQRFELMLRLKTRINRTRLVREEQELYQYIAQHQKRKARYVGDVGDVGDVGEESMGAEESMEAEESKS